MFCFNREKPGSFSAFLIGCIMLTQPDRQGYELMKQPYPTMKDLANGFKLIFANMSNSAM
jgi:hypothetical protein